MKKRLLSLVLAVALIFVLLPVTANAAESDSAWVELLEYSTVDNSGSNLFKVTTTGTISIDTPQYMTCTKVDMLITHPAGYAPSSVKLRYNNVYYTLTMKVINNTTVRVYGANIPDGLYANLVFQINKSTSASVQYQVLSCRVTSLTTQDFAADADVLIDGTYYDPNTYITVPGVSVDDNTTTGLVRISVYDWMKYDSLTIWGYTIDLPLISMRATIGTLGLPMTVSYMEPVIGGYQTETDEAESGYISDNVYSGDDWALSWTDIEPSGQWLYCVTIDLSDVDRTATTAPLYLYMTGLYEPVWGYSFNCNNVIGSIVVADTTNASWWQKFQTFMTNSFNTLTSAVSTGFSNVGTWISDQTSYLLSAINSGFTTVTNWMNRTYALIDERFGDVGSWFEQYFGVKDQEAIDDLEENSNSISQGASDIHTFEQSQQEVLDTGFATIQSAVSFSSFANALVFVQKYTNMTVNSINNYMIVYTLPLFLGLFFFLCSRIPGVTRWKSPPPKSNGGGSP